MLHIFGVFQCIYVQVILHTYICGIGLSPWHWPLYVKLTKSLASRPKSLPCKVVDILVDISAASRAVDDI